MPPKRRASREPPVRRNARPKRHAESEPPGQFQHPTPTSTPAGSRQVSFAEGPNLTRGATPTYSHKQSPSRSQAGGVTEIVHSSSNGNTDPASQQLLSEGSSSTNNQRSNADPWDGGLPSPTRTSSSRSRSDPQTQDAPYTRVTYDNNKTDEYEKQNPPPPTKRTFLDTANNEDQRDADVCQRIHCLRALVYDFALQFVSTMTSRRAGTHGLVDELCGNVENAQLLRYIGCLALAGPKGVQSWHELLEGKESLQALIVGIVGGALKEHVFSALWFGGTSDQIEELQKLQERQKDDDGYKRTKSRSIRCIGFKGQPSMMTACRKIAAALKTMLAPLYYRGQKAHSDLPWALSLGLHHIIDFAAMLSRQMRECGDVIYHWPPTLKDEEFDPDRMECLNIASMITKSPCEKKNVNGHERSVLTNGSQETAEAIVQIGAFPGLVVHRKGGGALAKRLLEEEAHNDRDSNLPPDVQRSRRMGPDGREYQHTGEEGFRTRVICKSVVHLIWGKQRLLTREAGTSAHLDAMRDGKEKKYEEDRKGYVELYDYFLETNPDASRALA